MLLRDFTPPDALRGAILFALVPFTIGVFLVAVAVVAVAVGVDFLLVLVLALALVVVVARGVVVAAALERVPTAFAADAERVL